MRHSSSDKRDAKHLQNLTWETFQVVDNALRTAREQYGEFKRELEQLAVTIRDGKNHPAFADGENGARGARGADRLALEFESKILAVEKVQSLMEDED